MAAYTVVAVLYCNTDQSTVRDSRRSSLGLTFLWKYRGEGCANWRMCCSHRAFPIRHICLLFFCVVVFSPPLLVRQPAQTLISASYMNYHGFLWFPWHQIGSHRIPGLPTGSHDEPPAVTIAIPMVFVTGNVPVSECCSVHRNPWEPTGRFFGLSQISCLVRYHGNHIVVPKNENLLIKTKKQYVFALTILSVVLYLSHGSNAHIHGISMGSHVQGTDNNLEGPLRAASASFLQWP